MFKTFWAWYDLHSSFKAMLSAVADGWGVTMMVSLLSDVPSFCVSLQYGKKGCA